MDLNIKTSNGKDYILPMDQHAIQVSKIIHRNDHPHPVVLIFIILIILFLVYYIYLYGIKRCFTGVWYNGIETTQLYHDIWTDYIYIDGYAIGNISGNAIYFENINSDHLPFMGILYGEKIYWTTGSIWTQVRYA